MIIFLLMILIITRRGTGININEDTRGKVYQKILLQVNFFFFHCKTPKI